MPVDIRESLGCDFIYLAADKLTKPGEDIKTIAERENLTGSYFTRLIRINFLAPDIIQAILLGIQPPTLDAATLLRYSSKLPLDWKEQRAVLGFK